MNTHAQADIELLRQYAESGSASAFAMVVARHADFVFAVALRQTRSRELAEDVTQAAFIVLARRARGLRDGASVAGFLHQTAVFAAKNALRAESRRRRYEKQAAIDPAAADASKQHEPMDDGAIAVDCALAQLRDGDRQFLMLHYFDGLNIDDLAAKLKISHEAARKRLHRALARLKAYLSHASASQTAAALPTLITAMAHPATSINASAVASSAVAGGINGRAFELASRVLLKTKLLLFSKAAILVAAVIAITGVVVVAGQQLNRSRAQSVPARQLAVATSRPATSAPAPELPAVDYAKVFSDMREAKDERGRIDRLTTDLTADLATRQAELAQLRKSRDAERKGSPEYVRKDQALKGANTKLQNDVRNNRRDLQWDQIETMAELYQKIEIAVTAVGTIHHLQLSPPDKPAYPARVDLITLDNFRKLCIQRAVSRPADAPDLTDEVITYLDTHHIDVPGIPPAPPAPSTSTSPAK